MRLLLATLFIIATTLLACFADSKPNLPRASVAGEIVLRGTRLAVQVASPTTTATRGAAPRPTATHQPTSTDSPAGTARPTSPASPTSEPTATPQSPATATPKLTAEPTATPEPVGIITGDLVNMRRGPGTNFEIVARATLSETVKIVGQNDDLTWWQVCCAGDDNQPVWVIADYLQVEPGGESAGLASVDASAMLPELSLKEEKQALRQTQGEPATPVEGGDAGDVAQADTAAAPAPPPAPAAAYTDLPALGNFAPPTDLNLLTGLPLPTAQRAERPVIVCINNDFAARPQFGLSQAEVMYEYLMEGYGITRFSGLFYSETVEQIGPVRSARLVNYYLGALYNAPLFCSGASDPVRYLLKKVAPFPYLDVDLDDPSNAHYSVSIGSGYRTRLRTNTTGLHQWLIDWQIQEPPNMRGFTFGSTPADGIVATDIIIPYPTSTGSNVEYRYDQAQGRYLRYLGDEPHRDGNTGLQLALDNVIVQYVPHEATDIVEDSLGSTSIRLNLFHGGKAILFRDGLAFVATWQSNSRGDTPHFFAQTGVELQLKPGKTWISLVPDQYEIDYE